MVKWAEVRSDHREYQVDGYSFYNAGRMESYQLFYYTEKYEVNIHHRPGQYSILTRSIYMYNIIK